MSQNLVSNFVGHTIMQDPNSAQPIDQHQQYQQQLYYQQQQQYQQQYQSQFNNQQDYIPDLSAVVHVDQPDPNSTAYVDENV
jgi:hypothetical protein